MKSAKPRGRGAASKKAASPRKVTSVDPGFTAKLAAWEAIIEEAVGAKTAAAARKAYLRADRLDHLPVDLFADDDADEAALNQLHAHLNAKLNARLRELPAASLVAHELCCLRDLINTT